MNKEKALKNQGLEFREDICLVGGTEKKKSSMLFFSDCSTII